MKKQTPQEGIEQAAKEGNYRALAAYLNDNAADLIKQILDKHMDTVLREMHEIVKQRNAQADKLAKVRELAEETRDGDISYDAFTDRILAILEEA